MTVMLAPEFSELRKAQDALNAIFVFVLKPIFSIDNLRNSLTRLHYVYSVRPLPIFVPRSSLKLNHPTIDVIARTRPLIRISFSQ